MTIKNVMTLAKVFTKLLFFLMIGLFACTPTQKDKAPNTTIPTQEKETQTPSASTQIAISEISKILKDYNVNEDHFYLRKVSLGKTFGDVQFHQGHIAKVTWGDEEIGINGTYTCWYNEQEELVFISSHDHGNNWTQVNYYIPSDDQITFLEKGADPLSVQEDSKSTTSHIDVQRYNELARIGTRFHEGALRGAEYFPGTRFYTGEIGSRKIIMRLNIYQDWAHGSFYFSGTDNIINISGNLTGNFISLSAKDNSTDEELGKLEGAFEKNFIGSWKTQEDTASQYVSLTPSETFKHPDGNTLIGITKTQTSISDSVIFTYFHDLPYNKHEEVSNLLINENFGLLDIPSNTINDLKDFLRKEIFENSSQAISENFDRGIGVHQNYFHAIYLQLPSFVSKQERHDGYYVNLAGKKEHTHRLFAYFIYRMNRSPKNVALIWRYVKESIFDYVTHEQYKVSKADEAVEELLKTYHSIVLNEDYQSVLDIAYEAIDSINSNKVAPDYEPGAYGFSVYDQQEYLYPLMDEDHQETWMFSFWMRRNHEGNMEVVANILREIQKHYN